MQDDNSTLTAPEPNRTPWNKGKLIGAKAPLMARHVWSIRPRLQIEGEPATWLCSISPSIASYAVAMWSV